MKKFMLLLFVCAFVSGFTQLNKTYPSLTFETLLQSKLQSASPKDFDGKMVVLEFWATWCSPCLANITHLNQVQAHFVNAPVIFISVTDEPKDKVEKFIQKRNLKGWIACDESRNLHNAYGVDGIPHTFIIDKNGVIVYDGRPEQVDTILINAILNGSYTQQSATRTQTANVLGSWSGGDDPVFTANFNTPNHTLMPWQHTLRKTIAPNNGGNGWRELENGGVGITYINTGINKLLADLYNLPSKIRVVNKSVISDSIGWDVIFSRDKGYTLAKAKAEILVSLKQALETTLHDTVMQLQVLAADVDNNEYLTNEVDIDWDNPTSNTYRPLSDLLMMLEERLNTVITYNDNATALYIDVFEIMNNIYSMPGSELKHWLVTKGITFKQTTAPVKLLWVN